MKSTDAFIVKINGKDTICIFEPSYYANNGNNCLKIQNFSNGDFVRVCSYNGKTKLNRDEIGLKIWSKEDRDNVDFLVKLGIIEDEPFGSEEYHGIIILYFKLTESGLELYNHNHLSKKDYEEQTIKKSELIKLLNRYFECDNNGNMNKEYDPSYSSCEFVDDVKNLVYE